MIRLTFVFLVVSVVCADKFRWNPDCGLSKYPDAGPGSAGRIVGGAPTRPNEYPWQVALRWTPGDTGFYRYCGGVLITSRYVLTAAHCMLANPRDSLVVVLGDHYQFDETWPRTIIDIEAYNIHDEYGKLERYDADIALVRLAEEVQITDDIRPACAPDANNDFAHHTATISGWGTMTFGSSDPPEELMHIHRNVPTNQDCSNVMFGITDTMICAGDLDEDEQDACQGDSGGPMTVQDTDGIFSVVGLVSWGIGCASGAPGVYCRVSVFLDWIDQAMADMEAAVLS